MKHRIRISFIYLSTVWFLVTHVAAHANNNAIAPKQSFKKLIIANQTAPDKAAQPIYKTAQANKTASPDDILNIQQQLKKLGYDIDKPDGISGRKTRAALRAFQKDHQIPITGSRDGLTKALLIKLTRETPNKTSLNCLGDSKWCKSQSKNVAQSQSEINKSTRTSLERFLEKDYPNTALTSSDIEALQIEKSIYLIRIKTKELCDEESCFMQVLQQEDALWKNLSVPILAIAAAPLKLQSNGRPNIMMAKIKPSGVETIIFAYNANRYTVQNRELSAQTEENEDASKNQVEKEILTLFGKPFTMVKPKSTGTDFSWPDIKSYLQSALPTANITTMEQDKAWNRILNQQKALESEMTTELKYLETLFRPYKEKTTWPSDKSVQDYLYSRDPIAIIFDWNIDLPNIEQRIINSQKLALRTKAISLLVENTQHP